MTAELSEIDVVRIAKDACASKGIEWREPYRLKKGWRHWRVLTPSNRRGGKAVVVISRLTGGPAFPSTHADLPPSTHLEGASGPSERREWDSNPRYA